jgi:hypothetical protein
MKREPMKNKEKDLSKQVSAKLSTSFKTVQFNPISIVFLIAGFVLVILGLVVIILWQRGLVMLQWLPCPDIKILYV